MAETEVEGWDAIRRSKPTIRQLLNYVIPKVAAKYNELGIELYKDSDVHHLDTIQKSCAMDYTKGCTEMLRFWLESYGDAATWDRLIRALKAPGLQLNAIALDIKRAVVKGQAEQGDSDAYSQDSGTSSQGDSDSDKLSQKPEIWDVISIVIPKVKASCGNLAYSMGFGIEDVRALERDFKDSGDQCRKLFEDWLAGSRGCTPKTWRKLLERIKAVSELHAAAEEIRNKLLSSKPNST